MSKPSLSETTVHVGPVSCEDFTKSPAETLRQALMGNGTAIRTRGDGGYPATLAVVLPAREYDRLKALEAKVGHFFDLF